MYYRRKDYYCRSPSYYTRPSQSSCPPKRIRYRRPEHPTADGLVDCASAANPAYPWDDDAAVDICAGMSPGGARFAIDKPAIERVAEPRSKRGDPIEAYAS